MKLLTIIVLLGLSGSLHAQSHVRVYAVVLANDSAGQFLGASSKGSGLYQSDDTGKSWTHLGWENIKSYSMDLVRSTNGRVLYLATGLGVLKSEDYGAHWRQMTDWKVAEVMDVAVNQKDPREVWIATPSGPWYSDDSGRSWTLMTSGMQSKYCSRIVFDTTDYRSLILAAEDGAYTLRLGSDIGRRGLYWKRVAEIDRPVRAVAQYRNGWNVEGDGISARVIGDAATAIKHRGAVRWTVSIDPGQSNAFFIFGGLAGADWHRAAQSEAINVKDVASSALVAPEMLLGTLGKGVYRRSTNSYTLDGRQVWTLRTALIQE